MAERIFAQDILNETLANAKQQEVKLYIDISEITGKMNILTTINGMSKDELMESILDMFSTAAKELGTPIDQVIFSGSRTHSGFVSVRLETEAEMIARATKEAENLVFELREKNKLRSREAERKRKRIQMLEEELAKLKI